MRNIKKLAISLHFVCGIYSAPAWSACTATTGAYTISGTINGCYSWQSGSVVISSGSTVTSNTADAFGSTTNSALTSFTNYGSITAGANYATFNNQPGGSTISEINNYGSLSNSWNAANIFIYKSVLSLLNNSGTITQTSANDNNGAVEVAGSGWGGVGTITSFNNSGTISSVNGSGVLVAANGSISTLTNSGSISATGSLGSSWTHGSAITVAPDSSTAAIGTITNTGSIFSTVAGGFGIWNSGIISTLNNLQGAGNANGGLTYTGVLPTNYNIILGNNASTYGKLIATSISGQLAFGIYGGTVSTSRYVGVLQGIASSNIVSSSLTGTYGGYSYQLALQSGQTTIWDLLFTNYTLSTTPSISASNTLASVQQNAPSVAATFNTQAAALQAGLTYDCNTFDENGLCASAGGRMTYAGSAPFSNQQAGLVIVSHKPSPYFRFGGYADQSVATATPTGIKQSNSGPMYGFFGYWSNQKDGMGLGASVTTSFSNNNLTVSRSNALANTEAGSGTTQMSGQGIQGQMTYALQATDRIKAIPYLGVRYYRVATGAYTEGSNADVTSPLSYNAMSQKVFAAVGGVGTSVFLAEKLMGTASVGIQQNLNYKMGNYQGTSAISGLETFSVQMPSNTNSMATATAGLNYAIKKNEKLGVNVLWQQQAFTATNTVTALATYSFGF